MWVRAIGGGLLLLSVSSAAGRVEPITLQLKAIDSPIHYRIERDAFMDGKRLSRVTQDVSVQSSVADSGSRVTMVIQRVILDMETPGGAKIFFDTDELEDGGQVENPMARSMVDGVDRLIDVPLSWTQNADGVVTDASGLDTVREALPGKGRAPGLATQILMGVEQWGKQAHDLMPDGAVEAGGTWTAMLSLQLGPGADFSVPVTLAPGEVSDGRVSASGPFEVDPATVPAGMMGTPTSVTGNVELVFDLDRGYYVERKVTVALGLDRGTKGKSTVETVETLTLEDDAPTDKDPTGE